MPGMFCRHNRLTAKCPICSRELDESLRSQVPSRPARPRAKTSSPAARGGARPGGGVVARKLARPADDGYRNPLVPGLRATADAERLAVALTRAAERIAPPGPYPAVAEEPDLEAATWLGLLPALAGPDLPDPPPPFAEAAELPPAQRRTAEAY